ncbi:hypothetical protein AMK14_32935 [Streptomyces sp. TSRI0445]|uniref:hypothetical protein n=1 Tax=Streptomyces TaxID=1883 RepID=UPI00093DD21E|nr:MULTISPECIES: hypothetical protein [unclassified Streptomyces]OKI62796.1 hypothetical protein AMK14_32935 [Streptomyces sp. TSRI0445]UIZ15994.1 hypothetical protein LZ559_28210 [Streptomyces sp. R527F]
MPSTAGRYSNTVRDVLDREALRCILAGGNESEQFARLQKAVGSKIKVLSADYHAVFDRAVKTMCTTSFNKVTKEIRLAALAGPPGPTHTEPTLQGPGCGTTPDDTSVPGPRAGATDDQVIAKVVLGEGGELTEKTARQLVLHDLDRIIEVLPPLAERDFREADRLDQQAKESTQGAKRHRARGNRILALVKRYDRLVAGIDNLPGIFTVADLLSEVGPQALGLDEDDAELLRYAGAL